VSIVESVPVMVELSSTAAMTRDAEPISRTTPDWPLAILRIPKGTRGRVFFDDLLNRDTGKLPAIHCEVWVDLPAYEHNEYAAGHEGHPMIRLWVTQDYQGKNGHREELCFLVCVRCEASFLDHCTSRSGHLGLMIAPSEAPEQTGDPLPPIVLAGLDPVEVAFVQLYAWRQASLTVDNH
jgi:hypothetical protein